MYITIKILTLINLVPCFFLEKKKLCYKVIVPRGMKFEVDRKIYESPKIFHVNVNTILCLRFKAFKLFVLN